MNILKGAYVMGKRRLTNEQIIKIANSYANGCDTVNITYLASLYNVSPSTISRVLHYAISNCIIEESTANLIAEKSIRHDTVQREILGYTKNNKVANIYNILLSSYKLKHNNSIIGIDYLKLKYAELKFKLSIFDESYFISDEYPFTKEELIQEINYIEREIDKLEGHLY